MSAIVPLLRACLLGVALLVLALVALALPARHALIPLWPVAITELVVADDAGHSQRKFIRTGDGRKAVDGRLIARSRPAGIACMESVQGESVCGYLVGMRSGLGEPLMPLLPQELQAAVADVEALDPEQVVVMVGPDEQPVEWPVAELRRLLHPNRLSLAQRAMLTWAELSRRIDDYLDDHGLPG
ncbi:hypothetical protein IC757_05440 [Wenzhouxiangella sp. AB-CW3]|uniref:hypothetical protein n=1 Tax=Wenzhouxiangella sp. AB-CW3 TaxID=2771012 RepID=UPI00168A86CC|nr:hypothetical protein [Wenzhouxiangella sp. AB-CW3]QOC23582.1 hypothetical protein IC757_05440 [Wenzhouxiangella sp. AB-CW3]